MVNKKIEDGDHTVRLNLHLPKSMKSKIEIISKRWGESLNETARQLIIHSPEYSEAIMKDFLEK